MAKPRGYVFTISIAAIIMAVLLLPGSVFQPLPFSFAGIDKVAHFALFFTFAAAYFLEYRRNNGRNPTLPWLVILLLGFAVLSETLQLLTTTRKFDPADMAYDLFGAATAVICTRLAIMLVTARRGH